MQGGVAFGLHRPCVGGPLTGGLQQKTRTPPWPAQTLRRCSRDE